MRVSRRTLWISASIAAVMIVIFAIFLSTRQHELAGRSLPLTGSLASFTPTDIMADGNTLVGYGTTSGTVGASIETVTIGAGSVNHLATLTNIPSAVVSDGRFVAWDAPQLTALDTQTQHSAVIPGGVDQRRQIIMLDQGQLIWETLIGDKWAVNQTDLGANTTRVLIPQTAGPVYGSWPYLLYPLAATWHLDDVTRDHDVTLAPAAVMPGALAGSTAFGMRSTAGDPADDEIVALQHADQPNATWQRLATVTSARGITYQANDRLVVWQVGYNHLDALQGKAPPDMQVYDRADKQTMSLAGTGNAHFFIHGTWLVIVSAQHVVTISDAA